MKKILSYFINGLILVVPIVAIVYILYSLFIKIDGLIAPYIENWFGFFQPGIGILAIFILLTILGFVGQTAFVNPIKNRFTKFIKKIPLVNLIFTSLNDLFNAFIGKEKKFNQPVAVHFNKENDLWKLGFLTKDSLKDFDLQEQVAVYFPHSYNFSGELYLVPRDRVKPIDVSSTEAMKFIVSAGVTTIESSE